MGAGLILGSGGSEEMRAGPILGNCLRREANVVFLVLRAYPSCKAFAILNSRALNGTILDVLKIVVGSGTAIQVTFTIIVVTFAIPRSSTLAPALRKLLVNLKDLPERLAIFFIL